jgi:hypothetical protein
MPTKAELEAHAKTLQEQADEAAAAAAAAKEEAAKPRTGDSVFMELLHAIVMHIGNPPRVQALFKELSDMKEPAEKPIELKPEEAHDATNGHTS